MMHPFLKWDSMTFDEMSADCGVAPHHSVGFFKDTAAKILLMI